MRLGADALYPTFADEKRKTDLPTETVEIMLKQGFCFDYNKMEWVKALYTDKQIIGLLFGAYDKMSYFCIRIVAKKMFFGDIKQKKISMQSVENKILSVIKSKKYGTILFANDFAYTGERKTINKAFERIAL